MGVPLVSFELEQNYPNPFNPVTTMSFNLPREQYARLAVYGVDGRRVAVLVDGVTSAGWQVHWADARRVVWGTVASVKRDPRKAYGWAALIMLVCWGAPFSTAAKASAPPKILTRQQYEQDFDTLWGDVRDRYAYFDQKTTDWDRAKAIHRSDAGRAGNTGEFVAVLERTLEELYDFHAHLNTNTASSPRLVPSGADIWGEWKGERAVVVEVRPASNAERAGVQAGMQIASINGVPIADAIRGRMGRSLRRTDRAVKDWALLALLAGRWNEPRTLDIIDAGKPRRIAIDDKTSGREAEHRVSLEHRRLEGNLGYIRIRNSLGDLALVRDFDGALEDLRNTRGLILDLRDTPSGGNTTVARGLMGRFITRELPYQKHTLPEEERRYGMKRSWIELVSPRADFAYKAPVAVLVDHWTGSMGEGIAIGLDGMGRATVVGTKMAHLLGATSETTLPNTGIGVSFPTEKLFHVNGTPRENFVPAVLVDTSVAVRGSDDPVLEAGLRLLRGETDSKAR
jgi:C-terminal processing protease CtpA/Prc